MPFPTTIRVYRAISPKSLAALREPLARQVFRVSKYDEEHGRRSFVVNADGSWVYDNTLRRGELGQVKMLLREEQDAREDFGFAPNPEHALKFKPFSFLNSNCPLSCWEKEGVRRVLKELSSCGLKGAGRLGR